MHIPHQAHVLITDGRKMLLFRNEGDADYPNLKAIEREEHESRPDRDEKSDAADRVRTRWCRLRKG